MSTETSKYPPDVPADSVWVVCGSHRARERAYVAMNRRAHNYFSFHRETGRGCFPVSPSEWEKIKGIKGVRRTRYRDDLQKCWNWGHKE